MKRRRDTNTLLVTGMCVGVGALTTTKAGHPVLRFQLRTRGSREVSPPVPFVAYGDEARWLDGEVVEGDRILVRGEVRTETRRDHEGDVDGFIPRLIAHHVERLMPTDDVGEDVDEAAPPVRVLRLRGVTS